MKRLFSILFIALLASTAYAAPAQDATIEKLLSLTNAQKMHESIVADTDNMIDSTITPMLQRQNLNARQKSLIDSFIMKYKRIVKDELAWNKMKPSYIKIYQHTFTEEELNELIAFYNSPTGKMFLAKTPVIMDKTTELMQEKIFTILNLMDGALRETMKEMTQEQ